MILMNDFKKEYAAIKAEIDTAVSAVLESGWYILGQQTEQFEKEFAKYCGAAYCVGTGNGMQALQIALLAAGIGKGDEVITTSLSAIETSLAISAVGATPIFADCDEYYHLDPDDVETKITEKTKALLPVHLFGQSVDIARFIQICQKHNLKLIEDACQAHGTLYGGKHVGTFGTAGCFSFYPTKNLGGYGDGGAIITNDEHVYRQCLLYRNAGRTAKYTHIVKGLNSRLDEMQSALLLVKLRHLDDYVQLRRERASWYRENLQDIDDIRLPKERSLAHHSYHLFVIQTSRRDALQVYLKDNGVEALIHFPTPIPHQLAYTEYNNVKVPRTEEITRTVLSLPINPFITHEEVEKATEKIKDFFAKTI